MKKKQKQAPLLDQYSSILLILTILLFLLNIFLIALSWMEVIPEIYPYEMNVIPEDVQLRITGEPSHFSMRVPIVMYHYIENVKDKKDKTRILLDTTPDIFEKQLVTMKQQGYTFMTMSELNDVIQGKRFLPQKPVVLTFDDGYRDFYTDAFPILKKYKIKAVIYVVPGFLDKPNYLFTDQLKIMSQSGLIEIGAHTVHHISLKDTPRFIAQKEIQESKTELEVITLHPVISFAYPYGSFDNQAIDLVKQAGFATAVSTIPGFDITNKNLYFLKRIRVGDMIGEELSHFLESGS